MCLVAVNPHALINQSFLERKERWSYHLGYLQASLGKVFFEHFDRLLPLHVNVAEHAASAIRLRTLTWRRWGGATHHRGKLELSGEAFYVNSKKLYLLPGPERWGSCFLTWGKSLKTPVKQIPWRPELPMEPQPSTGSLPEKVLALSHRKEAENVLKRANSCVASISGSNHEPKVKGEHDKEEHSREHKVRVKVVATHQLKRHSPRKLWRNNQRHPLRGSKAY